MTLELLNKAQLQILNRRSNLGYPLATAEKDYFLALVLKILYESPLGEKLVFKGGTALHHTYLPQLRFSEDLDFTAISAITLEEIGGILSAHDFLDVKESRVSDFTIKINRLKYTGPLGNPNSLKIEIDYAQNVVLPACEREYRDLYGVRPTVRIMDLREMLAEKIRAASGRARYRDFYDIAMIMDSHKMDISEVLGLVRRKEIRETISLKAIFQNWEVVKQEKSAGFDQIFYSREISDQKILESINSFGSFEIRRTQQL
jgi:predicted nucleotidyltransferase component of viral defense system